MDGSSMRLFICTHCWRSYSCASKGPRSLHNAGAFRSTPPPRAPLAPAVAMAALVLGCCAALPSPARLATGEAPTVRAVR